jgi:hypothetical protein
MLNGSGRDQIQVLSQQLEEIPSNLRICYDFVLTVLKQ